MKTKFYILTIFRCVDPERLWGPFKSYDNMVKKAKWLRHNYQNEDDGIFWMVVKDGKKPNVGSFTGCELE
jgi:hypothetical protein